MVRKLAFLLLCSSFMAVLSGCGGKEHASVVVSENAEAKRMLQGVWLDSDNGDVALKVVRDTILYPDSTSLPTFFAVYGDTLVMESTQARYPIVKLTNNVFCFKNRNGDVVKYVKSNDPDDSLMFAYDKHEVQIITEVLKKDTVVMYNGERYHCYIAINPTKYKVYSSSYSSDGVEVDNVYYDNIIHLSIYKGASQLFSRDLTKKLYSRFVPSAFLEQAVFSDMDFEKVDASGFHFNSTICIPTGASCYLLDTKVTFSGDLKTELLEY